MGWQSGIPIIGGVLQGSSFDTGSGDASQVTWDNWPSDYPDYLFFFSGSGTQFGDLGVMATIIAMADGNSTTLARIDVVQAESSPYVKAELIIWVYKVNTQNYDLHIDLKAWTDDTTYTTIPLNYTTNTITYYPDNIIGLNLFYVISNFNNVPFVFIGTEHIHNWGGAQNEYRIQGYCNSLTNMNSILNGEPVEEKKSPEFGPAGKKKGGYNPDHHRKGTFDDHSDPIDVTPLPIYDPCDAQFLKVWLMDGTDLAHLGDALFPQFDLSQLDLLGTWKEIAEILLNNKRVDYMLDLLIVPVTPSHNSGKQHITCGGGVLYYYGNEEVPIMHYVDGKLVQSCYVEVQCGSVTVQEYWANFLDFAGTKVKLFLPYVGFVDIQPEYIIGGKIKVWYRFNVYDGSFMAYVESTSGHSKLDDSLIGQYAGVAAVHLPLQSADYSQKISGLISSMGTVVAGMASGGVSAASAVGAGASLSNTLVSKPGSTHANGYNASSSFLSHKRPYLIIERQSSQFSEKYPTEVGLPLYTMERLGNCSGLTVAKNAHLDTIPAPMEIKQMIGQMLSEGIIV